MPLGPIPPEPVILDILTSVMTDNDGDIMTDADGNIMIGEKDDA